MEPALMLQVIDRFGRRWTVLAAAVSPLTPVDHGAEPMSLADAQDMGIRLTAFKVVTNVPAGRPILAADGKSGCPEIVWDGPYQSRCSMGAAGVCAHHGPWAVPS